MFFKRKQGTLLKSINNGLISPLSTKYNTPGHFMEIMLGVLLTANFLLIGINQLNVEVDPDGWDTSAYLGEAAFVKHHGGVTNFLNLCVTGKYKQANQHPLYILLLTPFATTDASFFVTAKMVSFAAGLILLIALFFMAKKMYGNLTASVAVLGLILSAVFIQWISLVACESWFMLLCLFCIYFIMEGFKSNKYWIYAGIFAGLAYLAKGSALLLLPGFALASIFIYRLRIFKNLFFWLFFILFALTASPLFIRNIIVYHSPFFNVNNYIVTMGMEKIDNSRYLTFDLKDGATHWKFEENDTHSKAETKNITAVRKSLSERIKIDFLLFLDTIDISWAQKLHGALQRIFALFLLIFFVIGITREKNPGAKVYFIITLLIFLLVFSINPIKRYYLPLIPFIWIYTALGIFTILELINVKFFAKYFKHNFISYISYVMIILLVLNAAFIFTKSDLSNPLNSVEYSRNRLDLLNWVRATIKKDELYTLGPNFNWQLDKGTWILPPKNGREDLSEFNSFIKRHHVSYVIIDREDLKQVEVVNKRKLLQDNFTADSREGLIEKKSIKGWNLVYKDRKKPIQFLVYKIDNHI